MTVKIFYQQKELHEYNTLSFELNHNEIKTIELEIINDTADKMYDIKFETAYPITNIIIPKTIAAYTQDKITFDISGAELWKSKLPANKPLLQSITYAQTRMYGVQNK